MGETFHHGTASSQQVTIPSYTVSYGQLQDLVRIQTSIIVKLQCKAEKQNECVSRQEYNDLKLQLENETLSHLQTKSKLHSREKELQFALSDIDILTKQLEEEKELFRKICFDLQAKAEETSKENTVLLEKCSEIKGVCGFQDDILNVKQLKINDLKARLAKQTQHQRIAEKEAGLLIQQERFLNEQTYKTRNNENKKKN